MTIYNIIGTIGAGKTTTAEKLHKKLNIPVAYEAQSKELNEQTRDLLEKYYRNKRKYALEKNLFFLEQRKQTILNHNSQKDYISDRCLYDDYIMAKFNFISGHMTKTQWLFYKLKYKQVEKLLKNQDNVFIFLNPSLETILKRVKRRGRKEEQISVHPNLLDYYTNLKKLYECEFSDKKQLISNSDVDKFIEKL